MNGEQDFLQAIAGKQSVLIEYVPSELHWLLLLHLTRLMKCREWSFSATEKG
jgi:hypothetical protein